MAGTQNGGIDQKGSGGTFTLNQSGNGNNIKTVSQFGKYYSGSNGVNYRTNELTVNQSSNNNVITAVIQDGGTVTNNGNRNQMTLKQRGASGNIIGDAEQDGSKNVMTVDQNGAGNEIANAFQGNFNNVINSDNSTMAITQKGNNNYIDTASQAGAGHNMTLTFNGNNNGQGGAFTHTETTEVVSAVNGAETIPTSSASSGGLFGQGYAMQAGTGNSMNMQFTGNNNKFAIGQFGPGDTIDGNVNGSYNEVALYQDSASLGGNFIT